MESDQFCVFKEKSGYPRFANDYRDGGLYFDLCGQQLGTQVKSEFYKHPKRASVLRWAIDAFHLYDDIGSIRKALRRLTTLRVLDGRSVQEIMEARGLPTIVKIMQAQSNDVKHLLFHGH